VFLYDFHLFYRAGQAVLAGISPYTIPDFGVPFPIAVIFALVAWIPEPIVYCIYLITCLWLLWKVLRWRSIWALLCFPVFFGLFVGQVDLLLTLLVISFGPNLLPIMILKPQVGYAIAPWYIRRLTLKQLIMIISISVAFLGICFLVRPGWLTEWLQVVPTVTTYSRRDSNLYWLIPSNYKLFALVIGIVISLPLGYLVKDRQMSFIILHLFSPLSNIYSASVLVEWIGPIEVVLSWIAIIIVGNIHSGAPLFVIGLSILIRFYIRERKKGNSIFLPLKKPEKT
jgi:hypothetical protein